jgi:hypothetical protein
VLVAKDSFVAAVLLAPVAAGLKYLADRAVARRRERLDRTPSNSTSSTVHS